MHVQKTILSAQILLQHTNEDMELIGCEGSNLHINGARLLDRHVQKDQMWSLCGLCLPDHIVNLTVNMPTQFGYLAVVRDVNLSIAIKWSSMT